MELTKFKRPQDEQDIKYMVRFAAHDCQAYRDGVNSRGLEAMEGKNVVLLPIGIFGWAMPLGVPFEVWSTEACEACGEHVRIMVEWTGPKVFDMKAD